MEVQQIAAWDTSSLQQTQDLMKAITANSAGITDVTQLYGGGALSVQSLEKTLVRLCFMEKHAKLYKELKMSAMKATNTSEEYSLNDGYGQGGGWVTEMENPEAGDPSLRRRTELVKYAREIWRTSDVITYTNQLSPAVAESQQGAMMRLIRTVNTSLYFGNDGIVPTEINGLLTHVERGATADHIFDMRGSALGETHLKQASELIYSNMGDPSKLFISPSVQTSIDGLYTGAANGQRFIQNAGSPQLDGVAAGYSVKKLITSFGTFDFETDIFLSKERWTVPVRRTPTAGGTIVEGATSDKAPGTPAIAASLTGAPVTGSKWVGTGYSPAGVAYGYRVSSRNMYGLSRASAAATATPVAGQGVILTITESENPNVTTGYRIFREAVSGSGKYYFVKDIAYTGSVQQFIDLNEDLPGTGIAFLIDNTYSGPNRVMSIGELAPIHSKEYAPIAPYRWGAINYYINLKVYAPMKIVVFKNILVGEYSQVSPLLYL